MKKINNFFSETFNLNFFKLLSKIFYLIKSEKNNRNFFILIIIVSFQAFLDVISLASIIPLIFLIQDKDLISQNMNSYISKFGIDAQILFTNNEFFIYVPITVILIILFSTLFRFYLIHKTNRFIENIRHNISKKLMDKYIYSSLRLESDTSEIAKSILSEVDQFIIIVFQPTVLMLTNIILLLGIAFYLVFTSLEASINSLIILLFFYFIFYIFSKRILNKEGVKSERANKGRFKTAIEAFTNIKEIKIYKAEKFFSKRFKIYSKSFADTSANFNTLTASPKYILEMIVLIAISYAVLIFGLRDNNDFNILTLLGTFTFSAYKAQPALSSVIFGINSIEYGSKIISNLHLKIKNKISRKEKNSHIFSKIKDPKINPVQIKNISFSYNQKSKNKILENLNFEIETSSLCIFIGESGVGKSTLMHIISGLIQADKGNVIFNLNRFNNQIPKISFLPQDHKLYDASIANNVALGIDINDIDKGRLISSLKKAKIFDYVFKLQNNINENVGENGSKLSVGQIQRIALARALYFKPDILILDEPTSGLDKNNEQSIFNTILKLSEEIIVIMTTHRIPQLPNNKKIKIISLNNQ